MLVYENQDISHHCGARCRATGDVIDLCRTKRTELGVGHCTSVEAVDDVDHLTGGAADGKRVASLARHQRFSTGCYTICCQNIFHMYIS